MKNLYPVDNPFVLINHSDIWRTTAVDEQRVMLNPALSANQHPNAEGILKDALDGNFGTLLGDGYFGRVYESSDPNLVVKQICNAGASATNIGLTFETLEVNIAAGKVADQIKLKEPSDHWRLTAPTIHAAVIQGDMLRDRHFNPPASMDDAPSAGEHLFIVMDKLPILPLESVQSEICADTFPSAVQVAAALSIRLHTEIVDIDEERDAATGFKKLHNMGVLNTPGSNAEPGHIAVYDLSPASFFDTVTIF